MKCKHGLKAILYRTAGRYCGACNRASAKRRYYSNPDRLKWKIFRAKRNKVIQGLFAKGASIDSLARWFDFNPSWIRQILKKPPENV
jgi:Mor family transcriptional regulator